MSLNKKLKIDLLISTMNYKDGELVPLLASVPDFVNVIIINQITDSNKNISEAFAISSNIICYSFNELGLSKSRNRALSLMEGDIFVISDDDVVFLPGAFEKIESAFLANSQQDILTFQMQKEDGGLRKKYKKKPAQHNLFSIMGVSSCEIAGRNLPVSSLGVMYDTNFGLGAKYSIGEEVIFLRDCLRSGLNVRFIPISISTHPEESSGRVFSEKTEFSRGAVFFRLFGSLAYIIGIAFYLKKYKYLTTTIGFWPAFKAYLSGICDYKKNYT